MKDELRLYCVNEGFDEEYLRSLIAEDRKLFGTVKKPIEKGRRRRKCKSDEDLGGWEKRKAWYYGLNPEKRTLREKASCCRITVTGGILF